MPNLPTISINDQAKFDRVVAAFGTAENYRTWLRNQIIAEVGRVESKIILDQRDAEAEAKIREVSAALNTM